MKKQRTYFAVVIDEYGGLSGIIPLHDLVEILVGKLDEDDATLDSPEIEKSGENEWYINVAGIQIT